MRKDSCLNGYERATVLRMHVYIWVHMQTAFGDGQCSNAWNLSVRWLAYLKSSSYRHQHETH